MGYKLNQYGLFYDSNNDGNNGKKVQIKNERDIFKKLGMEYKTLEEREKYNEKN